MLWIKDIYGNLVNIANSIAIKKGMTKEYNDYQGTHRKQIYYIDADFFGVTDEFTFRLFESQDEKERDAKLASLYRLIAKNLNHTLKPHTEKIDQNLETSNPL